MALSHFVIVSTLLVIVSSSNITAANTCKDTTPKCLKETIQTVLPSFVKENPKIGLQSLDPLVIEQLKLILPGNLKLEYRHGTSKGLRNCVIQSARLTEDTFDKLNNTLDLQFRCNLTIRGMYKLTGSLLMFTVNGDGQSTIKCKNIKFQFLAKLGSRLEDDGKKHLEIKTFKSSHTYEGQVYYRMTNLIKGNPVLGDLVVEFMNRNWKLVAEELGKPIVDFGIKNILMNIKKMLKAVPQDYLIGTFV